MKAREYHGLARSTKSGVNMAIAGLAYRVVFGKMFQGLQPSSLPGLLRNRVRIDGVDADAAHSTAGPLRDGHGSMRNSSRGKGKSHVVRFFGRRAVQTRRHSLSAGEKSRTTKICKVRALTRGFNGRLQCVT